MNIPQGFDVPTGQIAFGFPLHPFENSMTFQYEILKTLL